MRVRVHGKWILAGEHAVLRGCPALVFPMLGKHLDLTYVDDGAPARASFSGEHGPELQLLFWRVMERALASFRPKMATGRFELVNTLPIGAGLGASAALCVAVGRWFVAQGLVQEAELYEFARGLEDLFHGESSGVDVAVAISCKGMRFVRGGPRGPVRTAWSPRWYLSYSGKRGVTSECVLRVKGLFESDRVLAERLDRQMVDAVAQAQAALEDPNGLERLGSAIELARQCFDGWGLAAGVMGDHLAKLKAAGAIAAKPTGSGDGGFALSLWREPPDEPSGLDLISVGE